MTRFLALIIGLTLISSPAMARDDGGFGAGHFSGQAPTALGDYTAPDTDALAADTSNPALIEPAAGEEAGEETLDGAANPASAMNAASAAPQIDTPKTDLAPTE